MKMKINKHLISPLLAAALFATATVAQAAVHRVYPGPGDAIQDAIDYASPGDTILVEPGIYTTSNEKFGLHITTDNLRLIGKVKKGQGVDGKVIIRPSGEQITGIYAAPENCGPEVLGSCEIDGEEQVLRDVYIRGFTVEDFPSNGIQTRFVDGFQLIRNESARAGINGIYPTVSANGLVQNNVSYGTEDTAMWVAASQNVRVIGNDLSGSPIGLEVNVSLNIEVTHNDIHDNTVGIALFHPNSAGNPPIDVMGNWVVEHNNVYNNNLPNPAPPESFQGALPPGIGILVLGVSDNVVAKNRVENNDFVGIGVLGWCTAQSVDPDRNCFNTAPLRDPRALNNLVAQNKLYDNGGDAPDFPLAPLAADILYYQTELDEAFAGGEPVVPSGNCFKKNKPKNKFTFFSSEPFGDPAPPPIGILPTDGC